MTAATVPILSPRDRVLFPGALLRVELEDGAGLEALEAAGDGLLAVVPTLAPAAPPGRGSADLGRRALEGLAPVGTAARVRAVVRLPGGGARVTLQGLYRVTVARAEHRAGVRWAEVARLRGGATDEHVERAMADTRALVAALARGGGGSPRAGCAPEELPELLALNATDAEQLVDFTAALFDFARAERLALLIATDPVARIERLNDCLRAELLQAREEVVLEGKVRERLRRSFLREQLETIRHELGEETPAERQLREFGEEIERRPLPPPARERAQRELSHLRRAPRASSEASALRNWLGWLLELPWQPTSAQPAVDADAFERVRAALDETHTGLADVKQRVIEFLAVRQLSKSGHGSALCFLGPPGTGKSSMGRAVARALGRPFVHVAVGTITEESELRGVSKFEGGPGVVLAGIHRAGASDPVILLDEIDKLELGGSGTAGGALLEMLDPEHNAEFLDQYLGIPYDLSHCIFLATANDLAEVSEAVVDRLEVIDFFGYTQSEKLAIARRHLLPEVHRAAGLKNGQLRLTPAGLRALVRHYTEEAGVRQLRRVLQALARKAAVDVVRGGDGLRVLKRDLFRLLGPAVAEEDMQLRRQAVGVCTGLAWTSAGGALLPVEALAMSGTGRTILTGQVGEVMRESVQTALSYVRTLFGELGIKPDALDTLDVHIHFPSSATPKDGPSAGVAIAIALLSLLTRTPARHNVALTGEISLRGHVLSIGGLREKLLAAMRAGLTEVVVPARNEEDVLRMPAEIRESLTIHLIRHVRDAFGLSFTHRGRRKRLPTVPVLGSRKRAAKRARDG